jgi:hypothetical protein
MKSLKSCVGAASAAITACTLKGHRDIEATAVIADKAAPTGGVISFRQIYETSGLAK